MEKSAFLLCALVFSCVFVPFLALDSFVRMPRVNPDDYPEKAVLRGPFRFLLPVLVWSSQVFGAPLASMRPHRAEVLKKQLLLAAVPMAPESVLGAQAALALAGVLAGLALFALSGNPKAGLALGALSAFCGWFFPPSAVQSRAENRRMEIIRGLPFAIDLIGSAMHAGLDFNAAMRYYVGLGLKNPLVEEFGQTIHEAELGKSRVEALKSMADRVQTPAFTAFVDAVAHGMEIGASLVGTMRMQGEDMRRARFHVAEQKAARASSIMILPMAVFIMPAVFVMVFVPVWLRYKAAKGG
ncbi:MAG: type II secretion system F family protein [Kiritimatiellae bacterium]|nr:type II secretion system F family protein [Kiritimatiellia bacterium]